MIVKSKRQTPASTRARLIVNKVKPDAEGRSKAKKGGSLSESERMQCGVAIGRKIQKGGTSPRATRERLRVGCGGIQRRGGRASLNQGRKGMGHCAFALVNGQHLAKTSEKGVGHVRVRSSDAQGR